VISNGNAAGTRLGSRSGTGPSIRFRAFAAFALRLHLSRADFFFAM
jgi:hypothetical protein